MGPYVNPSETYNYYDLPFCQHTRMEVPKQSLGETLKGDELTRSLFDVRFKSELFELLQPHATLHATSQRGGSTPAHTPHVLFVHSHTAVAITSSL